MPKYNLNVNGQAHAVDAPSDMPLLWVLRDMLGLVGTKYGCGKALCGACTVHLNGQAIESCSTTVAAAARGKITTIEGLAQDGKFTTLQQAWCDHDVSQCGYCQSGQIMRAAALLATTSNPTDEDINSAMSENLCRCGTYIRIREAVKTAAQQSSQAKAEAK